MNVKGQMQGQIDSPLTNKGIEQAEETRKTFAGINFDVVFSSDLLRAQRTAELVVLEKKLVVNTSKLIRERAYGRYEGKIFKEYEQENRNILDELRKVSNVEYMNYKISPDVESGEEMVARTITFLREVAVTYTGKTVLVVSHGGLIRNLLIHLGWANRHELSAGAMKNCGYVKLRSDGVDFWVDSVYKVEKGVRV